MVRRLGPWVVWCVLWAVSGAAGVGALGCGRPLPADSSSPDGGSPTSDGAVTDTPTAPVPDAGASCPTTGSAVLACGCGCCGGAPSQPACYYPGRGESPATIDPPRVPESCANVGCSAGVRYLCCAASDAPTAESASYCAYDLATNVDQFEVLKTVGGICTRFRLEGLVTNTGFPVSTPSSFKVVSGHRVACISSAAGERAIGAIGTVTFGSRGAIRLLDVHVTVFFDTSSGTADAVRFDADDLELDGPCGS